MEKKVTFSVKALIINDNKFLALRRNYPNPSVWELPGGHLEYGETAPEALIREIKEEVNYHVKPLRFVDTWDSYFPNRQITGIIYLCQLNSDINDLRLSEEHGEYRWLSCDSKEYELLAPTFASRIIHWDWSTLIK
ncbi:NUDIX hydrolase [Spirochaeta cellobiosiphila]|uniref:NUDIX hydrolase n=1 Tax=Spirochaeta cellobiosiphila TaxID=504483 RepID=UPI00040310C0|nr:NUDIX hydrolase [Spirochaeta cellobiosiphila]